MSFQTLHVGTLDAYSTQCARVGSWISFAICFFNLLPQQMKVMHKHLLLFQNATTAYFAGNKEVLNDSMKKLYTKYKNKDGKQPFILEHLRHATRARIELGALLRSFYHIAGKFIYFQNQYYFGGWVQTTILHREEVEQSSFTTSYVGITIYHTSVSRDPFSLPKREAWRRNNLA